MSTNNYLMHPLTVCIHTMREGINISHAWDILRYLLRASPAESLNFCTIWRINNDFYFLATHFFKYTSNRLSIHSLSHLNIISSFIVYSFFNHHLFFFKQLYFSMRSVMFTTFYAIFSQQNLCGKLLLVLIWTCGARELMIWPTFH